VLVHNLYAKQLKQKGLKTVLFKVYYMEIKVLEKGKNFLKIEILGEDHTFANALRKELWNDKDVKVAGYELSHSLVSSPILIVETSSKNPKTALSEAVKRLKDFNDEMKEKFKKLK